MRILHIGKYFPPEPGGMEVFLSDLVAAQRHAGDDVHALVHGTPQADDPAWLTRVPVAFKLVYAPVAIGFRAALRRALRRLGPDVLHLHMPNPSVFWALTLREARELPWVVHWHSDVLAQRALSAVSLAYTLYRPFEQAVLEHAERIVVTSPDYVDASAPLRAWRDKCVVIPLGVDVEQAQVAAPHAHTTLGADTWPADRFRLLSVGRLAHYKGFDTLLDVVAEMDGVHLVVVGDGEQRAQLEARAAAQARRFGCSRVTIVGAIDEASKLALVRACDAFCLASCERTEAFGIAVMEAMQQGKPCIVSELPGSGLPWLVRSSGAGLTVPVGDVHAWRAAIAALRANPERAQALGAAGQAAIASRFDIRAVAQSLQSAYPRTEIAPLSDQAQPLVVIPARDEADTIGLVIGSLRLQGFVHIVVVDDQSRDDTAAIARAAGAKVLSPVLPLGAWGAMQTGIRYAARHGYAQVVTLDADGQHEPACIPSLLEAARTHDVVIGAFPQRGSRLRRIAWRYFRALTGFGLEDLTSGFRCYNRAACEILSGDEATLFDYQDMGVLLLLRRAGLSITEVPVEMYPRLSGPSRIFASWSRVARYMLESSLLCLAQWHPRNHSRR